MLKALKAFSCTIILIALAAESAYACKCSEPIAEESFRDADAVFQGKVVSLGGLWNSGGARFKVEKSWKGVDVDEVIVHTVGNTCAFSFEEGETYVIFAGRSPEGELGTWACSASTNVRYNRAAEVFAYLQNQETIPLAPAPPSYLAVSLITALCVSIFIAIGILVRVYFRRAA